MVRLADAGEMLEELAASEGRPGRLSESGIKISSISTSEVTFSRTPAGFSRIGTAPALRSSESHAPGQRYPMGQGIFSGLPCGA